MKKEFSHGDYECKGCGAVIDDEIDTILYKNNSFIGFVCRVCNTKKILKKDEFKKEED